MATVTEIDVMKAIDEALSQLQETETRDRILKWAWAKFGSGQVESPEILNRKEKTKKVAKKTGKAKTSYAVVKDLNLKPAAKMSFKDFVLERGPSSDLEKCAASVYYLKQILKIVAVSSDHVYTCFKEINWRVPSDLDNALQRTASLKGWVDTANMLDIKVTIQGENLIEHDLPRKKEGK